jgi:hypothetical protein
VRVERLFDDASRALSAQTATPGTQGTLERAHRDNDNTITAATELKAAGNARGD